MKIEIPEVESVTWHDDPSTRHGYLLATVMFKDAKVKSMTHLWEVNNRWRQLNSNDAQIASTLQNILDGVEYSPSFGPGPDNRYLAALLATRRDYEQRTT